MILSSPIVCFILSNTCYVDIKKQEMSPLDLKQEECEPPPTQEDENLVEVSRRNPKMTAT